MFTKKHKPHKLAALTYESAHVDCDQTVTAVMNHWHNGGIRPQGALRKMFKDGWRLRLSTHVE